MSRRVVLDRIFVLWFLGTVALSLLLLWHIAPTLDYYPLLSDDEGQILSDARTIALYGRFGSDLYQGAWNTYHSLYISPPLQRVLIAAAFRLAGESITTARAVTVISALVVLWCMSLLAWRHYGWGHALAACLLLVTWRSHLGGDSLGLAFLGTARSARYDLTAVAFIWLALLALSFYLEKPTRTAAILTGLAAGLAALTQFFGAFVIGVIVLALFVTQRRNFLHTRTNALMLGALLVVLVPYALLIWLDWHNFVMQTFVMKPARTGFTDLAFYLGNFSTEVARYREMIAHAFFGTAGIARQIAALTALVAIGAACANLYLRLRRRPSPSEWVLPLSLVVFVLGLALFDSTKAPLYSIVLYPSLCLALGILWTDLVRGLSERGWKLAGAAATLVVAALLLLQYGVVFVRDRALAAQASRYTETTALVLDRVPQDARILTSARMAWGLRERSPDTTIYLALAWHLAAKANSSRVLLPELLGRRTQYLVLDNAAFVDFASVPLLEAQFREIFDRCVERVTSTGKTSYGTIYIYRLTPEKAACPR